jgi:hypothetical protein
VLAKRWRELRPAFARLSDFCDWSQAKRDIQARCILMMKDVGTEVYLTTWNPKDVPDGPDRVAYAKKVVDYLEYLVRTKGCSNLKYYCMTNELSLKQWGSLQNDLPKFRSYHKCLYDELAARKLDIQPAGKDQEAQQGGDDRPSYGHGPTLLLRLDDLEEESKHDHGAQRETQGGKGKGIKEEGQDHIDTLVPFHTGPELAQRPGAAGWLLR